MLLTYETIMKIVNEEKASKVLVQLPEDLFIDVKNYIEKKSQISGKEEAWEIDSAKRIVQDLLDIRERKILSLALSFTRSGVTSDNMAPEEEEFFDTIVKNIKEFQKKRRISIEGEPIKMDSVAFLEQLPEFVGIDMNSYGPFRKGDVANLPEENAKLLVEKRVARKMEI